MKGMKQKMFFTVKSYSPLVIGSGAGKLADSQIAPLVAAVRGYRSYSQQDGAAKKPWTRLAEASRRAHAGRGEFTAASAKRMFGTDGSGDVMLMPWYSLDEVLSTSSGVASFAVCQARPEHPEKDPGDGRAKKYVFPAKTAAPVSIHPAFTEAHVNAAPRIWVTEGIIKEDSLLTAMLLHHGITAEELALPAGMSADDIATWARYTGAELLRELIGRIPTDSLIIPVGVAGVNGWTPAQFTRLPMLGKDIVIGFDGDVATNARVWHKATHLWEMVAERGGTPKLMDLGSSAAVMEIRATEKFSHIGVKGENGKTEMIGVDDYLSHVGTLATLLEHLTDTLPARPESDSVGWKNGDWRVTEDGLGTQEFRAGDDPYSGSWRDRVPIGGKVTSITIDRIPTLEEIREGRIHQGEDRAATQRATVDLAWRSEFTGEVEHVTIDIPAEMLNRAPATWPEKVQNSLPAALTMHPSWPPKLDAGMGWLSAIKRNSGTDWRSRRAWGATGWVPSDTGDPVYIIGDQQLGATRTDEQHTFSAVDDSILPSAHSFGVHDVWWETVDPDSTGAPTPEGIAAYKQRLCTDIETVVKHFLDSPVWNRPYYGAVLLGTALRTTIPKRPGLPIYLQGTPGSGKSWSASFIMGAWQKRKGVWSAQRLPGSASSTAFAMEKIMAVCGGGVWVADDLAPSVSQSQAINAEAGIESLIRTVFNDAPRQRGTKEGGLAKAGQTRAQLVITAENPTSSTSALERVLTLQFEKGSPSNPDGGTMRNDAAQALVREAIDTLALSRVTAAMIRFWHQPHPTIRPEGGESDVVAHTWGERITNLEAVHKRMQENMRETLETYYGIDPGTSARRVQLISEVMVPLLYLSRLYAWAGGADLRTTLILTTTKPETFEKAREKSKPFNASIHTVALADLAAEQLRELAARRIGQSLITAISNLLARGKAYLLNPVNPGQPPFPINTPEGMALNRSVGWEVVDDKWRGRGDPIGFANHVEKYGGNITLLHTDNAFDLAQDLYSYLVPHGQKSRACWQAVIAEGLATPPGDENAKGAYSVRIRMGGPKQRSGVLVPLSKLLGEDV